MKGPTAPVIGSGDPASRSDWVVESTTSILRREPWSLVDDFYSIRLPDFVVVAPVTEDGRLVLVRHYRHGPRRVTHSLPSGFIEGAESPGEAAKRELLEETGYAAGEWSALGSYVVDGNRRCGLEHVFLATGVRRVSEPSSADLAESTVELIKLEEATETLRRGDISELASAAGLSLALLKISESTKSTPGA